MEYVDRSILKRIYPKRDLWSRKLNFGNLLIIGGSKYYPTTPAIAAMAAYRAGVDWVTIAAPEEACKIMASYSPNLMIHPLSGEYLSSKHLNELINLTKKRDAIVIGGGITRGKTALNAIVEFLSKINLPCVIDDDAIYAVAMKKEILNKNFVVTPHSYEFFILSDIRVENNVEKRAHIVKEIAEKLNTNILLKGHVDVISNGIDVVLNKTGTPYMTKAGLGNILSGICGALLARKIDCFTAACAAAYINGLAGEIASKKYRESLLPTDLIETIPLVIR